MNKFISKLEDRFFRKPMEQFSNQPAVQAFTTQVPVPAPAPAPAVPAPVVAPVSLPSAFNCPLCLGEGLKDQYTLCSNCRGTGKI